MNRTCLAIAMLAMLLCSVAVAQPGQNPIDQMLFFGGSKPNHIPQAIDFLSVNKTARAIAIACLEGATVPELETLHLDSLQAYLKRLVGDSLMVEKGGKYYLTIPVFVTERRERLRKIVEPAALKMVPVVEKMLPRLQKAIGDRQEMLFHLLWSRVVDANWWNLYQAQYPGDENTPPSVAWVMWPLHPYQCGTNFWSMQDEDEMALTWSNGSWDCLVPVQDARPYLIGLRPTSELSAAQRSDLLERKCIDSVGTPRLFSYITGDSTDQLFDQLKAEFAAAAVGLYDYQALAKEFGVLPDDLYVILIHETAYSIFEQLDKSGKLPFPPVFRGTGTKGDCVQIASVRRLTASRR